MLSDTDIVDVFLKRKNADKVTLHAWERIKKKQKQGPPQCPACRAPMRQVWVCDTKDCPNNPSE